MIEPSAMRHNEFAVFREIPTRWMDNDVYGHVNNVVYYSWFDTAVNGYLLDASGVDIRRLEALGVVAETGCRYLRSVSFPQSVQIGLAVEKLGRSSIVYRLGVFTAGHDEAAALGRFVHVYVDANTRRSVPIPDVIRTAVQPLLRTLVAQ